MIARNLDEAYLAFDPLKPLSGEQLQSYYVGREPNPVDRIRAILLGAPDTPDKILFTGHRGCGKSTELNRLLADIEIQRTFLVVPFSLADMLDPLDLGYMDLLIAIEAGLYRAARESNVEISEELVHLLADFWMPQSEPIGFVKKKEEGASLELLDRFFDSLIGPYGKLRLEPASREYLRQALASTVSTLISHIALLAATVRARTGRNVLVAIDDLDKPDIATAQELFYRHATALTQPPCKFLYTIPIALLYTAEFVPSRAILAGGSSCPISKCRTAMGLPARTGGR